VELLPAVEISAGDEDDQLVVLQVIRFPAPVHRHSPAKIDLGKVKTIANLFKMDITIL
jgi:hypothetical protein